MSSHDNSPKIKSISVEDFKCFQTKQTMDDLAKINVIIGLNNSGKSSLIDYLCTEPTKVTCEYYTDSGTPKLGTFGSFILNKLPKIFPEKLELERNKHTMRKELILIKEVGSVDHNNCRNKVKTNLEKYSAGFNFQKNKYDVDHSMLDTFKGLSEFEVLYAHLCISDSENNHPGNTGIDNNKNPAKNGIETIRNHLDATKEFILKPLLKEFLDSVPSPNFQKVISGIEGFNQAQKEIVPKKKTEWKYRLSDLLEELKSPNIPSFYNLDVQDSRLIFSRDKQQTFDTTVESLGSGVRSIIGMVWQCHALHEVDSEVVICMDEPEQHLYPELQKRFLHYIHQSFPNTQFLIATHSPSIINWSPSNPIHSNEFKAIYTLSCDTSTKQSKGTSISRIEHWSEIDKICEALGARPSDLLQANFILWVEGPSDIIYFKHWIQQRNSELTYGIDYIIMFYGGANLASCEVNDIPTASIEKLVNLKNVCRKMAIVVDRDCSEEDSEEKLKSRVKSIKRECEHNGIKLFLTDFFEVEDYLNPVVLTDLGYGEWDPNKERFLVAFQNKIRNDGKRDIAEKYVKKDSDFSNSDYDRKSKLDNLIDKICTEIKGSK